MSIGLDEFMRAGEPKCCAKCAFLCERRSSVKNFEILEANITFRRTGEHNQGEVVCYKLSDSFISNQKKKDGIGDTKGTIKSSLKESISKPIECDQFVKWIPFVTPKEQAEISRSEQLDKEFREWQDGRSTKDQKWRVDRANEERGWRKEDVEDQEKRHKWTIFIAIFSSTIALITAIGGPVGAQVFLDWRRNRNQQETISQPDRTQQKDLEKEPRKAELSSKP